MSRDTTGWTYDARYGRVYSRRSRKRMYIWECKRCERWQSVKTLEQQRLAKAKGMCMDCENEREGRLRIFMKLCQLHMESIALRAGALPEDQRKVYRQLYRKRQRAYLLAKALLEDV